MPELQPAQFAVISRVPPLTMPFGRTPAPVVHSVHTDLEEAHRAYRANSMARHANGIGSDVSYSVEHYPLEPPAESEVRRIQRTLAERKTR